jgi:LacI family transcriptional regulator, repressor for deo operon, udp, cdd, tsx, nupC, and nupG
VVSVVGIEDVAKLAGVSTATVSRALSGKPHVSDRARAKVEAAANELGYVPSSTGYTLATGRHRNIGVVLPFIDRWFFSAVLDSSVNTLAEFGYDVALYDLSGGEDQRARTFNELLLRKRVDGLITISVKLSEHELENLTRINKPIVGIGGPTPGARSLAIDEKAAGRLATEHLISLGHTRIGVIAGTVAADMYFKQPTLRRDGYREALDAAGLEIMPAWTAEADFTVSDGYRQAKQILGDHRIAPTAIFCLSDEMAFGAIMAAKDLGLRIPEDISIIGFDDHDLSEFYGLTTISQGVRSQGRRAANLMVDLLNDPELASYVNVEEHHSHPVELIIRSSTAKVNPARASRL